MLRERRALVIAPEVIFAIVLAQSACLARAEGQPGKRPDRAPSGLSRAIFGASLESQIIKQSGAVERQQEKFDNTPSDKKEGFLLFKRNAKEQVLKELKKQKDNFGTQT